MIRKSYLAVALLATLPLAAVAGTSSIGTASARGDMRVDNYKVQGNATLFDGSVVQAGVASVDVRMPKGVQLMLASDSQGTLYRDHLVLDSGASSITSSTTYSLEAKGLRVTPNEPNTHGVVSVRSGNNVEVAALSGGFGVTSAQGVFLANVVPGKPISIPALKAGVSLSIIGSGVISSVSGHYVLTTASGKIYQLKGNNLRLHALVGKNASISGTLDPSATPTDGASGVIALSSDPSAASASSSGGLPGAAGAGLGLTFAEIAILTIMVGSIIAAEEIVNNQGGLAASP